MKFLSFNRIIIAASVLVSVAFFYSCKKEASVNNSSTTISQDSAASYSDESAQVDGSFDDVGNVSMVAADADDAAVASSGGRTDGHYFPSFTELRSIIGDCATITVSPDDGSYPKTITADFGDSCVGPDGKLRRGEIVILLTGRIRQAGSVATITLVNFYLNRKHLEGTKVISNLSEGTTIKYSVVVTGGKVTFPNGRGYSYHCNKYKEQIAGMDTPISLDNVFSITGNAEVDRNNGTVITFEITDPLIKKVICPWITDGTLKTKINDFAFKLDYGFPHNGDCDNKALLTWNNGNSQRVVTLP
ncbi:MAG: hypothetical protein JSU05_09930 [Bacteroidetes bacterium]|nr:hypothetical protein [Bacteroidota bacterium]